MTGRTGKTRETDLVGKHSRITVKKNLQEGWGFHVQSTGDGFMIVSWKTKIIVPGTV